MPANSSETEMKCPETSPSSPTVKPTRSSTGSSSGSQKSDFFRTRLKAIEKRNRAKYSKKIKDCENSKASLYQEKLSTIIGGHALDLPAFKFMLTRCRSYPNKYVKTKKRNTLTS